MPQFEALPWSAAAERNREPILARLRTAFGASTRVLEIGAGTGQHAVAFASALPALTWLPTEHPDALPALAERIALEGPPNCAAPRALDVLDPAWPEFDCDAAYTANTLHIISAAAGYALLAGVARTLPSGGLLAVYGPFRYRGVHTSASNEAFDQQLRARDPASGIRDVEALDREASAHGLGLLEDHAMPANNRLRVWRRLR